MKKPNMDSKPARYYMARKSGKNKKESAIVAGYSESTATKAIQTIENTQDYKALQLYFKDELQTKISMSEIADALIDNIVQKNAKIIDRGSRNKAIEIALSKLEPDRVDEDRDERVIIVMKG